MKWSEELNWGVIILIGFLAAVASATSCYHKVVDAEIDGGYYEKLDPHQIRDTR